MSGVSRESTVRRAAGSSEATARLRRPDRSSGSLATHGRSRVTTASRVGSSCPAADAADGPAAAAAVAGTRASVGEPYSTAAPARSRRCLAPISRATAELPAAPWRPRMAAAGADRCGARGPAHRWAVSATCSAGSELVSPRPARRRCESGRSSCGPSGWRAAGTGRAGPAPRFSALLTVAAPACPADTGSVPTSKPWFRVTRALWRSRRPRAIPEGCGRCPIGQPAARHTRGCRLGSLRRWSWTSRPAGLNLRRADPDAASAPDGSDRLEAGESRRDRFPYAVWSSSDTGTSSAQLLLLQRLAGNQAVARLVATSAAGGANISLNGETTGTYDGGRARSVSVASRG